VTAPYRVRPIEPDRGGELAFVRLSWLRTFEHSHYAGVIPGRLYYKVYDSVLDILLGRPGALVLVAADAEDENHLMGFCCTEPGYRYPDRAAFQKAETLPPRLAGKTLPLLHYVYVPRVYRRAGLGLAMVRAGGVDPEKPFVYTFKNETTSRIVGQRRRYIEGMYDPLVARYELPQAAEERKTA
jgi:hypothetical protein